MHLVILAFMPIFAGVCFEHDKIGGGILFLTIGAILSYVIARPEAPFSQWVMKLF